jgi:hypothetical protein
MTFARDAAAAFFAWAVIPPIGLSMLVEWAFESSPEVRP